MAIAPTVAKHLKELGIEPEVVTHIPTPTASQAAEASHVSGNLVAKGVLLKDAKGYLLAVLPASHHLDVRLVADVTGRQTELATEADIGTTFADCDVGAVPALGAAYGLEVIVDQSLVRLAGDAFDRVMGGAGRGVFSRHD
jgi:Ala-tRNA(Pro) deacylase